MLAHLKADGLVVICGDDDMLLKLAEETDIAVIVDNSANEVVYPQMADFTFYGGIYRDVNLVCVNDFHFDLDYYGGPGFMITPQVSDGDAKVEVEVFVKNLKEGQKLVYTIYDKEEQELDKIEFCGIILP